MNDLTPLNESLERMRGNSLLRRLLTHGCEFDFQQAAWLLERFVAQGTAVGGRGPMAAEGIRFRPHISMGFPSSDVRRVQLCDDGDTDRPYFMLDVTFLGLYGVSTPLPLHYATGVLREVHRDAAKVSAPVVAEKNAVTPVTEITKPNNVIGRSPTRDFLDLLHHRLLALFYRAGLKYRHEMAFGTPGRDELTRYLHWLIGYPLSYDAHSLGVPPLRLLRYVGTLTRKPRSAAELEGVLSDYFGAVDVRVEQCQGRWITLGDADHNAVGKKNSRMGVDLTIGAEVFDLGGSFVISIGPVDWATYESFVPDQPRAMETRALAERFCCDPLLFTLEITVQGAEIPELRLGAGPDAGRLGFTTWVRSQDMKDTTVCFASEGIAIRKKSAA